MSETTGVKSIDRIVEAWEYASRFYPDEMCYESGYCRTRIRWERKKLTLSQCPGFVGTSYVLLVGDLEITRPQRPLRRLFKTLRTAIANENNLKDTLGY